MRQQRVEETFRVVVTEQVDARLSAVYQPGQRGYAQLNIISSVLYVVNFQVSRCFKYWQQTFININHIKLCNISLVKSYYPTLDLAQFVRYATTHKLTSAFASMLC